MGKIEQVFSSTQKMLKFLHKSFFSSPEGEEKNAPENCFPPGIRKIMVRP